MRGIRVGQVEREGADIAECWVEAEPSPGAELDYIALTFKLGDCTASVNLTRAEWNAIDAFAQISFLEMQSDRMTSRTSSKKK